MLARGASAAFIIFSFGHLINLLAQIALARWLGVSEYGEYSYVVSWTVLLTVLAGLGLNTATVRFIPSYSATSSWGLARGFLKNAYLGTIAGSVGIAILADLLILLASGGAPSSSAQVMMIGMWLLPAATVIELQTSIARAYQRITVAYLPGRILRYVIVVSGVAVLLALGVDITSREVVLVTVGGLTVLAVVQFLFLRRNLKIEDSARYDTGGWWRVAMPLLASNMLQESLRRTDILLIGIVMDSRNVGIYTVATRIASLVTFILASVNTIAGPMIASTHARKDKAQLQKLLSLIAHGTFWPSIVLTLALAVVANPLLGYFGPEFRDGHVVLLILLCGQLINATAGSVGAVLNMTGHHRDAVRVLGVSAGVNLVAVFVGIQLGGIVGAAIATACTNALWNIWLHKLIVQRLGVYPSLPGLFLAQRSGSR